MFGHFFLTAIFIYLFLYIWIFIYFFSSVLFIFYFIYFIYLFTYFTILYWFCHTLTWIYHESKGVHVFPILNPPLTSFPFLSLWVIPAHQPWAFCIMYRNLDWGFISHVIIYVFQCHSPIPSHPRLSHRVQKTALNICVSFAILHTGLSLPSF